MPGKFAALAVATEITDRARLIGSANTLVRNGDGWRADNTDCDGVTGAIRTLFDAPSPHLGTAVIIGAGGTARPALWALAELGVSHVTIINRSDRSRELADLIAAIGLQVDFIPYDDTISTTCATADVIISTVPAAGIAEHVDKLAQAPLLDVIYDPWPTPLVTAARNRRLPAVGGHVMLAHQAYGQFEQFTGYPAPREAMWGHSHHVARCHNSHRRSLGPGVVLVRPEIPATSRQPHHAGFVLPHYYCRPPELYCAFWRAGLVSPLFHDRPACRWYRWRRYQTRPSLGIIIGADGIWPVFTAIFLAQILTLVGAMVFKRTKIPHGPAMILGCIIVLACHPASSTFIHFDRG